ncbi:MAG: outer membrane lipoprotein carrier protein LolA [Bacteroidales bacterium]|nr:outer membrane lipoprotein carrier protein LolA [Bacteroidales bacterium]
MKRVLLYIICLLTVVSAFGQNSRELVGEQRLKVINEITRNTVGIQSLSCQFTQTKQSSLLVDNAVSKGEMSYSRPKSMRWEYTSPYTYALVVEGDSLSMTGAEGSKKPNQNANRMMKEMSSLIIGSINGDRLFDERTFSINIYEETGCYRVKMNPKRKDMQRMFQNITFLFGSDDYTVRSVVLTEKSGDATTINFENVTIKR